MQHHCFSSRAWSGLTSVLIFQPSMCIQGKFFFWWKLANIGLHWRKQSPECDIQIPEMVHNSELDKGHCCSPVITNCFGSESVVPSLLPSETKNPEDRLFLPLKVESYKTVYVIQEGLGYLWLCSLCHCTVSTWNRFPILSWAHR